MHQYISVQNEPQHNTPNSEQVAVFGWTNKVVSYTPGHNHHAQIMSCNLTMSLLPAVEEVKMNDFGVLLSIIMWIFQITQM